MADNWDTYGQQAQSYLNRPIFGGTPLKGSMFSTAAKNTYDKYKINIPIELALSQAQLESSMGRTGRNPTTNPFNVFEYDSGTKKKYNNIQDGVNAYFDLMARRYLNTKTLDELLTSFTNDQGKRYASDPNYEKKLSGQVKFIKKLFGGKPIK
jgi:flagellum-specific peptidoglycan hydrolase FlgJ